MKLVHIYFKKLEILTRFLLFLLSITTALINFGCAAMFEGSSQTIRIHSEPSYGLTAIVDGEEIQFNNGLITLCKKRETHFLTLKKDGYHPSTLAFNREINPIWPVADLIWLPAAPIAWLIDWRTASVYQIDPKDVNIVLRKKGGDK